MPFLFERKSLDEFRDRKGANSSPSHHNKISNHTKESSMQSLKLKRFALKEQGSVEKRPYPSRESRSASGLGKPHPEDQDCAEESPHPELITPKALESEQQAKKPSKSGTKKQKTSGRQGSQEKQTPIKKARGKKKQ